MTIATVAFGAITVVGCGEVVRRNQKRLVHSTSAIRHTVALTLVATWLVIGMLFVMVFWALFLVALGVFNNLESSLYFSMISFTTLGFGDVILPPQWRLLSGFIAIDGFFLFGLNTAFVFEVLRRLRDGADGN